MNVLFCTSEGLPYIMSGGLGDVAGALPKALCAAGVDCRVIMPLYSGIRPELRAEMEYLCHFQVPVAWRSQYCGLFRMKSGRVTAYFLDNEYYFKRDGLYGYGDDGERYAFFSRAVLEALRHLDFVPDILHTNDWQTALVSLYLNLYYRDDPKFANIKTLFTIHNIQYQGQFGMETLEDVLGIGRENASLVEYGGCVNYMKAAIEAADRVNTVSPTYAQEIMQPQYGHGLDPLLRQRSFKVCGIVNGIDTEVYDPATDPALAKRYNARTVRAGKAACRAELCAQFGLEDDGTPIIGMVSRLVDHKGFDLVCQAGERLVQAGMKIALLGTGDKTFEEYFQWLAGSYPGRCGAKIAFQPALAHKIYAGADVFLMPSRSEPCGLAQMVALRYGTVPIVRETGGLKDTVQDSGDGQGNGFTFADCSAEALLDACLRAQQGFADADGWRILQRRCMACDHSWAASCGEYRQLYETMLTLW